MAGSWGLSRGTDRVRQLSLAVVGLPYPNKRGPARRFEAGLCIPGEAVELRPEPNHPKDEHAIAVFSCRGVQLGYLASERAVLIGTMMRQGREPRAILQGLMPTAAWIRVAFDGEEPVLPVQRSAEAGADDSGFWPDPTYED